MMRKQICRRFLIFVLAAAMAVSMVPQASYASESADASETAAEAEGQTDLTAEDVTTDTSETSETSDISDTSDVLDTSDASETSVTSGASDTSDTSDTSETEIVLGEETVSDEAQNASTSSVYDISDFITWMLSRSDLTDAMKADLENAQSMLSGYVSSGEIILDDSDDAASLTNLAKSVSILQTIDDLRQSDEYYNQLYDMTTLYTNFTMMVGSAYTANVSIYKIAHVSDYGTFAYNEGLAWGYDDPTDGWYTSEKAYITQAMADLGYSVSGLTTTTWSKVKTQAYTYGEIGHYTGLFYGVSSGLDTLMGLGYTTESYLYGCTSSYNACSRSNYSTYYAYTIDEFESYLDAYADSVGINAETGAQTAITSASLSKTKYTYDGKKKTPTVTVKNSLGETLTKGTDYSVTYSSSGRKSIGTYTVTIKGKGNYSGTIKKTFKIVPKKVTLKSTTKSSSKKKLTVSWKKVSGTVKYQIAYKKKGSSTWKYKTVGTKTLSKTISGLKSGKYYYVKVRAYKKVNGKTYYGSWSKQKKVKVK